jgi:hypothetical protein
MKASVLVPELRRTGAHRAVKSDEPLLDPAQPAASPRARAAGAIVTYDRDQLAVLVFELHPGPVRAAVLDHIGQRLGDGETGS